MELEVKLKRNSWHNKLMTWTMGEFKPDLYSLCPYFWLTIFCIFFVPFTLIFKIFNYFFSILDKMFNNNYEKRLNNLSGNDYADLYLSCDIKKPKPFTFKKIPNYTLYYRWKDLMLKNGKTEDEIAVMLNKAVENRLKEKESSKDADELIVKEKIKLETERKNRIEKRKKMWIPVVIWTKRIFNLALTVLIMCVISIVINFLVVNITLSDTKLSLMILAKALGIMLSIVLFVFIVFIIVNYFEERNTTPKWFKIILFIPEQLGKMFIWIFKRFKDVFGLFISYFKATKNDYCPAIQWDDEEETD